MPKRAGIYIRVSSERQHKNPKDEEEKASVPKQLEKTKALCERHGYTIIGYYQDIERYRATEKPSKGRMVEPSGKRRDRPEYLRLCADVEADLIDVVVTRDIKRIGRDLGAWVKLRDVLWSDRNKERFIHTVWDGRIDKTVADILTIFAEKDNTDRREKVIMAGHYKLAQGKFFGGTPAFGFDYDKENDAWVLNPEQAPWIEVMFRCYVDGEGPTKIRQRLIAGNVPQKRGAKKATDIWREDTISQILKNPCYTGRTQINWEGKIYALQVPQIISEDLFNRAQERRKKNTTWHPNHTKLPYLLQGILVCGDCGCKMYSKTIRYRYGRNGQRFDRDPPLRYYHCGSRYGCENKRPIPADALEQSVWRNVSEIMAEPELYLRYVRRQVAKLKSAKTERIAEAEKLKRELSKLREERERTLILFQKNYIGEEQLDRDIADIDLRLPSIESAWKTARMQIPDDADLQIWEGIVTNILNGYYEMLNRLWKPTDENQEEMMESRREFVESLVEKIVVHPGDTYDLHASAFLKGSLTDPDPQIQELCQQITQLKARQWRVITLCASKSKEKAS